MSEAPGRTRVASVLVAGTTAVVVALLVRAFPDLTVPVAVGATGAALGVTALWLAVVVDSHAGGVGAGLLFVPAGIGAIGGPLAAVMLLVEQTFPVEAEALLSVGLLSILGHVGVVLGCSVAVLGAVFTLQDAATGAVERGMTVVVATAAVPGVAGAGFLLVGVLTGGTADRSLVAPVAGPVNGLGGPLVGLVPNWLFALVTLAAAVPALTVAATRLQPRVGSRQVAGGIAAGLFTTVGAVALAEWVYAEAVAVALRRFPEDIETDIGELSTDMAMSVGESAVVLTALVGCLGSVGLVLLLLYLGQVAGSRSARRIGASLAAAGTFLGVVAAATIGAGTVLVVGGVAASMLVWDAGEFGETLAREVGARDTGRLELVHFGGTALVGVGGIAGALVVVGQLPTAAVDTTPVETVALSSVVVGLLALVLALR